MIFRRAGSRGFGRAGVRSAEDGAALRASPGSTPARAAKTLPAGMRENINTPGGPN